MTVVLKIEGMSCSHCQARVQKALEEVPGVKSVEVSLEKKEAVVTGDDLDVKALAHAVTAAGYAVTAIE